MSEDFIANQLDVRGKVYLSTINNDDQVLNPANLDVCYVEDKKYIVLDLSGEKKNETYTMDAGWVDKNVNGRHLLFSGFKLTASDFLKGKFEFRINGSPVYCLTFPEGYDKKEKEVVVLHTPMFHGLRTKTHYVYDVTIECEQTEFECQVCLVTKAMWLPDRDYMSDVLKRIESGQLEFS